jgi:hypothetical protein
MLLNLFITIPNKHPGSSVNDYFSRSFHSLVWSLSGSGGWVLPLHVGLELFLVLGSLSLFMTVLIFHNNLWSFAGGINAFLTPRAFFIGMSFIVCNKITSYMIMGMCWVGAVGFLILVLLRHTKSGAVNT